MREAEILNYSNVYQDREVPASFSSPKDDAPAIIRTYSVLESMEKPARINALVLGVGDFEAIKKINNIFWHDISNGGFDDSLTIVDIRSFSEKDRLVLGDPYIDRTFLQQADARELPFEDNSFNLVLTHCFFPCFRNEDLESVLEEIDRVTVPRGMGIHTFRDTLFTGRALRRIWSSLDSKRAGCVYFDRSRGKMETFLNRNNFEIVSMRSMQGYASCENLTVGCVKKYSPGINKYKGGVHLVR